MSRLLRDPFGPSIFDRPSVFGRTAASAMPTIPEEEQESFLGGIGSKLLGGLGWLGQTLDKPGRAARGLLTGKPSELLNLIPFSDSLGITSPETTVSGRDMLEKWGILSPNQEGLDAGDVAGFGAEILTDPLSWSKFGTKALTEAGKRAKAAGQLSKTAGQRILNKEGSLMTFAGIPFGTGQTAAKFADRAGDVTDWLSRQWGMRHLAGAFNRNYGGLTEPVAQRLHANQFLPDLQERMIASRRPAVAWQREYNRLAQIYPPDQLRDLLDDAAEAPHRLPANVDPAIRQLGEEVNKAHVDFQDAYDAMGLNQKAWRFKDASDQPINFIHRQRVELADKAREAAAHKVFGAMSPSRQRDLFGGLSKNEINALVADESFRGLNQPSRVQWAKAKLGSQLPANATPGQIASVEKQAKHWADFVMDPSLEGYRGQGAPKYFGNTVIDDFLHYIGGANRKLAGGNVIKGHLAENITPDLAGQPGVRLSKAIKETGLKWRGLAEHLVGDPRFPGMNAQQIGKALKEFYVPQEAFERVTKTLKPFSGPEPVQKAVRGLDWLTNLWRSAITLWPGKHFRDVTSDVMNTALAGGKPTALLEANKLLKPGATLEGIEKAPALAGQNLTAKQATDKLVDEMLVHNVFSPQQFQEEQQVLQGLSKGRKLKFPGDPDYMQTTVEALLAPGGNLNPFDVEKFRPYRSSRALESRNMFRAQVGNFIDRIRKGDSFGEAARAAKEVIGDFGPMTSVESNIFRRLFPFYGYSRANVMNQLQKLTTQPGPTAGVVRAMNAPVGGEFTPEHIRGGVAIPIGERKGGMQRFLSSLGTPLEEATERFKFGPRGFELKDTAMAHLGAMNPVAKTPLELIFGKQFFSGRDLADLHPYPLPEELSTLNQILASSPASRVINLARQLGDERKGLPTVGVNLFTGARLTDQDIEKSLSIEGRKAVEELLRSSGKARDYTRLYVPEEQRAELTPEEARLLALYAALEQKAKKVAQEKAGR